ncbi:uncharacterized protein [Antedon mediterranea]|uniref:uncharacterized protein n=1 Tax=Antedon mediterranea TaxID=105859 RepID=UPI003AF56776
MVFEPETFFADPTQEVFNSLKKDDLLKLATHLGLKDVESSMRKNDIKSRLLTYLVEEDIFDSSVMSSQVDSSIDAKLREIELQNMKEIEIRRMELEFEREERDFKLKLRELELASGISQPISNPKFDVTKHIRLVPPFQEKEVDKFFLHFEKIAENLKWPKEHWTLLLQSVLTGKAREIYTDLSFEQSSSYDVVKELILKGYELVPEAYRQQFRNKQRQTNQTHLELAQTKERLFDRWCASKQTNKDYDRLRQLILIEEFKSCITPDVRTYLDEQKAETLSQAARLADDYALTHKQAFTQKPQAQSATSSGKKFQTNDSSKSEATSTPPKLTYTPNKSDQQFPSPSTTCNYCKKPGHIMSECFALKRKEGKSKPSGLVLVKKQKNENLKNLVSDSVLDGYSPFMSDGFVSLIGDDLNLKSVRILRDTGASQSLLLEGILPLSDRSSTWEDVLLQGIELGYFNVPLHNIVIKSDFINGPVVVGVLKELPFMGVTFVLGNDLAGAMVKVDETTPDPSMFPVCAITHSISQQIDEVILGDTFLASEFNSPSDDTLFTGIMPRVSLTKEKLIAEQVDDSNIYKNVISEDNLTSAICTISEDNLTSVLCANSEDNLTSVLSATELISITPATKVESDLNLYVQNNNGGNYDLNAESCLRLQHSEVLANLDAKFVHLTDAERTELTKLVLGHNSSFPDVPVQINNDDDAKLLKEHPYHLKIIQQNYLKQDMYMLQTEPSFSQWSSPCVLVLKPDGSYRLCTDFRKVNVVPKADSYPLTRINDCLHKLGKFDLLKGYWQVSLIERVKDISAFVTNDGLYQYNRMPFGMRNAPATFQRLLNSVIADINGCEGYIDDVIVYSDT